MATLTTANTLTTLNGLFKVVYADKLENLIPDGVVLMKEIPFVPKDQRHGASYKQPVIVGMEHGFTYGGIAGEAFALNDAVPGQTKEASVDSYEFVLRTAISLASVSRSENDKGAFERATKMVVSNMVRSFAKRLEVQLLYGQLDIGIVSAVSTTDIDGVGSLPSSQRRITFTTASWAAGIWSGGVNMKTSIWDASSSFAALDAAGFTVKKVDIENKRIVVQEGTASAASTIATSDVFTHFGAGYYQETSGSLEFAGLQKIMSNTGTLFGISALSYDLWKSTTYSAGSAALSFAKINKALAQAVSKGLDEDVTVHLSPVTWENLLSDEAALRRYTGLDETAKRGANYIEFYGQNGKITLRPNIYVKESLAFIVPSKEALLRVGSSDVTFKRPGKGDEYFRDMDNNNGYELRAYADMALFCHCPNKLILVSGIVNS